MEEEEREEAHAGPSYAIAHSSGTAEEEESNNRLSQLDSTHAVDGDTSMAEDNEAPDQEEVLYYVDAEGNRIDPSDMGDYSVVQVERQLEEQVIEQSKETVDSTMLEDVNQHGQMHTVATAVPDGTEHAHLTTMQEEEEGHDQPTFTMKVEEDEANQPGAQAEGDADHEDVHDHEPRYEQDEATRARYERPFKAPPSYLSDNNINHNHTTTINNGHNGNETPSKQNNTTPDYKVRFTISGHKKNVSCIQFSPDGRWLMTAGGCRSEPLDKNR